MTMMFISHLRPNIDIDKFQEVNIERPIAIFICYLLFRVILTPTCNVLTVSF